MENRLNTNNILKIILKLLDTVITIIKLLDSNVQIFWWYI